MNALVSILIPCYNAERWIAQAIESALAQTWVEKEIIVVDDGSTDRSLDIIKSFDGRILWETGPNRGGGAARNRLLELAHGDWVQYLDADDCLLPHKISDQVLFANTNAHARPDIIFGPAIWEYWTDSNAKREVLPIPSPPHDHWVLLAGWHLPQTGALLWRRQSIFDVGGWKSDQPCCQEHELYLRLLMAGKRFAYCPSVGAIYRQWSDSTVCKRDIPEVHRRRLEIEQHLEDYLRQTAELTADRLRAINQARFQIARGAWQYNAAVAREIMTLVRRIDPNFVPNEPAAPLRYRVVFRLFGFGVAEQLAGSARRIAWLLGGVSNSSA